jgi:hypothetical protein
MRVEPPFHEAIGRMQASAHQVSDLVGRYAPDCPRQQGAPQVCMPMREGPAFDAGLVEKPLNRCDPDEDVRRRFVLLEQDPYQRSIIWSSSACRTRTRRHRAPGVRNST